MSEACARTNPGAVGDRRGHPQNGEGTWLRHRHGSSGEAINGGGCGLIRRVWKRPTHTNRRNRLTRSFLPFSPVEAPIGFVRVDRFQPGLSPAFEDTFDLDFVVPDQQSNARVDTYSSARFAF